MAYDGTLLRLGIAAEPATRNNLSTGLNVAFVVVGIKLCGKKVEATYNIAESDFLSIVAIMSPFPTSDVSAKTFFSNRPADQSAKSNSIGSLRSLPPKMSPSLDVHTNSHGSDTTNRSGSAQKDTLESLSMTLPSRTPLDYEQDQAKLQKMADAVRVLLEVR